MGAEMAIEDILEALSTSLELDGLDMLDSSRTGDLALPRMQEVAAALARLRSLAVIGAEP